MQIRNQRGFSLVEMLVSLFVLVMAMGGLFGLLIQNSRINKSAQMTAEAQSNARNSLSLIVQVLRSAGWDLRIVGVPTVTLDPNTGDIISEITVFADIDGDQFLTSAGEDVHIRHVNNQIIWRRTSASAFEILADNISNDADGDGTIEPMFVEDAVPPTRITVQITARSPVVDPTTRDFVRYTVSSDVVLRKSL